MPYDNELAARVRAVLADRDDVREIAMFGGLAFMVADRMVGCVSAGGHDLLVRIDPAEDAELLARPGAARPQMGHGRSMGPGWIGVDRAVLTGEDALGAWLGAALRFHAQGPPHRPVRRGRRRSSGPGADDRPAAGP